MNSSTYSFRVIWSDDDNAFVATCPEFEGVSGLGDTAAEALAEAEVALALMLETYAEERWPLPAPTNLQEYSGQFRLRVPRSLHARLAEAAADEGVSLNTYALTLLAEGVGEARTVKQVRRCMDDLALRLRSDLFGGFFAGPNPGSAYVLQPPAGVLVAREGVATTGGYAWQS